MEMQSVQKVDACVALDRQRGAQTLDAWFALDGQGVSRVWTLYEA